MMDCTAQRSAAQRSTAQHASVQCPKRAIRKPVGTCCSAALHASECANRVPIRMPTDRALARCFVSAAVVVRAAEQRRGPVRRPRAGHADDPRVRHGHRADRPRASARLARARVGRHWPAGPPTAREVRTRSGLHSGWRWRRSVTPPPWAQRSESRLCANRRIGGAESAAADRSAAGRPLS